MKRSNMQHGQRRRPPMGADIAPLVSWVVFLLVIAAALTLLGSPS